MSQHSRAIPDNQYWQEDPPPTAAAVAAEVVDLVFAINCRALPVDHAWMLSQALGEVLPWWHTASDSDAGLHLIHGGDSGNGWNRPTAGHDILYLTRRTRLMLRLPRARIAEARAALQGQTLSVANHALAIGAAVERPLGAHPVLYARYVVDMTHDEELFLADAARTFQEMGVSIKKMLPGKSSAFETPTGPCVTRSLLVVDLKPHDALILQRLGLGPRRNLGCGLFIPHKTLANVTHDPA